MSEKKLKEGDVLICIQDLIMNDDEIAFKKGRCYDILSSNEVFISLINELGRNHILDVNFYPDYLTLKSTSEKKQTAVEWVIQQLYDNDMLRLSDLELIPDIESGAKKMEREQMIGLLNWMNKIAQNDPMRLETDPEDIVEMYLSETYKSPNQTT